jgi:hypothetical protein
MAALSLTTKAAFPVITGEECLRLAPGEDHQETRSSLPAGRRHGGQHERAGL